MDQEVVKPSDVQAVTVKPEDVSPVAAQPPPDEGGFFHWGSRPSDRQRATEQLSARGGTPVRASASREDTQVLGTPPELVPLMLMKGIVPAVHGIVKGVGVVGRMGAAATAAAPAIKYQLTKSALEAIGASPGTAATIATVVSMRGPGGKAAAAEAPLSAEGQALATAERGATSGVPSASVRPTPSSGSLVSTRVMPSQSGSGLPRPGAVLQDIRGNAIRPMGGMLTNPDEVIPSSIPPNTGGVITPLERAQLAARFREGTARRLTEDLRKKLRGEGS